MNRKRRRALVSLEAERILREKGELCISDLTWLVSKKTRYQLNSNQLAAMLVNHPRISKRHIGVNRMAYFLGNFHIPPDES